MKRLLILLAAGLLVLTVVAPAAAEPKRAGAWVIDCSESNVPALGEFTVHAIGLPGWAEEGQTAILFTGAEWIDVWEGGDLTYSGPFQWHQGLHNADKLVGPCEMWLGDGDPDVFHVKFYGAWYFYPRMT